VKTNYDGAIIKEVFSGLSELGYSSCADVLTASEFGVPQIRRRAFIVAYHSDLGMAPEMPRRTHERVSAASELVVADARQRFEPDRLPYVSVEDAIGDLPTLKAGSGEDVAMYSNPPTSHYQQWARMGSIALFNHRSRSHSADYLKKISVIVEGGRNSDLPAHQRFSDNYYSQAYARLHRLGLANTITTSFGNPGSGRFIHYRDLRSITVREAARLQSFPDRFVFDGDLTAQMRHVGNAVPPLLARAIRDQIARDLSSAKDLSSPDIGKLRGPSEERSRTMRAVPSKNTSAELSLRNALSKARVKGYRLHCSDVPGCPDLVFRKQRVVVFVDGCFWHGCPKCYRAPATNKTYWKMKVERNRDRDSMVNQKCSELGWRVIRTWEHEAVGDPSLVVDKIKRALKNRVVALKKRKRTSSAHSKPKNGRKITA
jgi:DNA mismatch endonuclease Vsr